jgi:GH15 family glucan-1,4-alpha-glucosidase
MGLQASGRPRGYHQIWARDSMIALLGASQVDDPTIHTALLASLVNLERHQSVAGAIPNNVDIATGKPSFRAYADGGLWYVIGSTILRPDYQTIQRVLAWYQYQDVDASGLISIQEASDWEDLFCTRGQGLYVNCLHVMALEKAAEVADTRGAAREAAVYRDSADTVRSAINRILWYQGDGQLLRNIEHTFTTPGLQTNLGLQRWIPQKRILLNERYYLPFVSFREAGEWFDSLGNLMAILSGVADAEQSALILDFIDRHALALHPMKAIYPPVEPNTPDWRDYYGTMNLPHHYHNGGIWPFIGGFYVAALVKAGRYDDAQAALVRLAELNRSSNFCECLHGETVEPIGVFEQAWSAGMYLYAAKCVAAKRVLLI